MTLFHPGQHFEIDAINPAVAGPLDVEFALDDKLTEFDDPFSSRSAFRD